MTWIDREESARHLLTPKVARGAARRRRHLSLARREEIAFYLFVAPWLLGLVFWIVGPMVASFLLSFSKYDIVTPPTFAAGANYAQMLAGDDLVWQSVKVTLLYSVGAVPLGLLTAFCLALLLNQKIRGIGVFRTIYYLPAVISGVPVALLWTWIFNPDFGVINNFLAMVGIQGPKWLFSEAWVLPSFIIVSLWTVGAPMVIYLAALQGVPQHLYEAAEIDGAGSWARLLHVTVPAVSPITLFNAVMGVIASFQLFTPAYVMTQGGPNNASLFFGLYLFNNAFRYFQMGYASALAWLMFVIILFITLLVFRSSPYWVYYEGGDR